LSLCPVVSCYRECAPERSITCVSWLQAVPGFWDRTCAMP
jgi:hypothetical protein